jgi:predicted CxxxxCH...CXXCH cytochrome family protein
MKNIILFLMISFSSLIIISCSELESNIAPPPVINTHSQDILNTTSVDFHGNLVRQSNWDMSSCKQCHGGNYDGGLTQSSCFDCHSSSAGPENCATCHGSALSPAPPRDLNGNTLITDRGVGAHQVHLAGNTNGKTLSCAECHSVPTSVYVAGHIDSDSKAEVLMNNYLANLNTNKPSTTEYDPSLPLFVSNPVYNSSDQSCANTYCHGHFKNGNLNNKPVWTNPETSNCGSCHGDPSKPTLNEQALPKTITEGGSHPNVLACQFCHAGVVNENLKIINFSKHIDGKLNLFGNDIEY